MLDHQKRVIDEAIELDKKLNSLEVFIKNNREFRDISLSEKKLLHKQVLAMDAYSLILHARITGFADQVESG